MTTGSVMDAGKLHIPLRLQYCAVKLQTGLATVISTHSECWSVLGRESTTV